MSETKASILVVDDEPIKRSVMEDELREAGYKVVAVASPLEAEPHLAKGCFDVVLTDLRMPGQDGLSFMRDLKTRRPAQAVIVMTAFGTVETAVEAMKLGAFDYLEKPFSTEELLLKIERLLRFEQLASENEALRRELTPPREDTRLIGDSPAMRRILTQIRTVAGTDSNVLIEGETGTGKELVARIIHETSHRSAGPFVAVSCAALPRELIESELFGHEPGAFTGATGRRIGRLELAHGGTLFMDDVDDIPLAVQVKLLRALESQTFERVGGEHSIRVNTRLIAATKKCLSAMVADGEFREDLYYRLNVVPVYLLPLRERVEDIPPLIKHFLERVAVKLNRGALKITPAAIAKLQAYGWPGNVRELEHLVERMVAMSDKTEFDEQDIPELDMRRAVASLVALDLDNADEVDLAAVHAEVEERLIRWALQRAEGNLARAADMLGIPRSTLQYKVSKLGPQ